MKLNDLMEAVESLEIKIAYQEDTIESLNQTIIQQQAQMDAMQQTLNSVVEKMNTLGEPDLPTNDQVELPPHY